jgi:hypothetical protein
MAAAANSGMVEYKDGRKKRRVLWDLDALTAPF